MAGKGAKIVIVAGIAVAAAVAAAAAAAMSSQAPDYGGADMSAMRGTVSTALASPALGDPDAPVTIIEFGDYQCHQCYNWFHNTRPGISSEYIDTGKASLVFVDMAFLGRHSPRAAEASHCAGDQGMYWEYHNTLYRQQGPNIDDGWAADERLRLFAGSIGLDAEEFNECLDSGRHKDRVEYNTNEGIRQGVSGTPTFVIVGPGGDEQRIVGAQPYGVFREAIESVS